MKLWKYLINELNFTIQLFCLWMPKNQFDQFYNQTYYMFKKQQNMHINQWVIKQSAPISVAAHSWNSTFIYAHHNS